MSKGWRKKFWLKLIVANTWYFLAIQRCKAISMRTIGRWKAILILSQSVWFVNLSKLNIKDQQDFYGTNPYPCGVGAHYHGLRDWLASNKETPWCYLGYCWPIDETVTISCYKDNRLSWETCPAIYTRGSPITWRSGQHISDRDPRSSLDFWESLQKAICTKLNFASPFSPTDSQSEWTI